MLQINKIFASLFLSVTCLSVSAVEPSRFDTSSQESMLESTHKVTQDLPPERRTLLAEAIIKLGMVDGAQPYTLPDGTKQRGIPPEKVRQILHGRTAEEIIALAAHTPSPIKSVEFKAEK